MVQISIQAGQNFVNTTSYRKHRVFVVKDESYVTFDAKTNFLLDGKVRNVRSGIDEQIDSCAIEFPAKAFGNLVKFTTPIAVAIDSASNIVFRGFLIGDTGVLNRSEDTITAQALGLKWLLSKTSKIRGKIFTVDNNQEPPVIGGFSTNQNLFEKFRIPLPTATQAFGYLGQERCIFNQGGNDDCATNGKNNKLAIAFKEPPSRAYLAQNTEATNLNFKWTYATILRYIERYYILPFIQDYLTGFRLRVSENSYKKINDWGLEIGETNIQPINFDIDSTNPMEAIERLVRAIPGPWYWRIINHKSLSEIDLINDLSRDERPKSMFIGTGGKILGNDGRTNVAAITASRNIRNGISHAIAVGGPIKIETTIEYVPRWPRYLRPTSDLTGAEADIDSSAFSEWTGEVVPDGKYLSNFKNPRDYQKWKHYKGGQPIEKWNITNTTKEIVAADVRRYEQVFRDFEIPGDSKEITRNISDITLSADIADQYGGFTGDITGFIFQNLDKVRTIEPPLTKYDTKVRFKGGVEQQLNPSKPFVFLYDEGREAPRTGTAAAAVPAVDQTDKQNAIRFIIPRITKDAFKGSYSFDNNFRVLRFTKPQYSSKYENVLNEDLAVAFRGFAKAIHRNAFVSCRIGMDVPTIADKLDLLRVSSYGQGRFVSYKFDRKAELTIRSNAVFPIPHTLTDGVPNITYALPSGDNLTGQLSIPASIATKNKDFPLIDFNMINKDGELVDPVPSQVLKNDFGVLTQSVEDILSSNPEIEESLSVDHGRVDLSYGIGDVVDRIVGSELGDGTEGYYGLNTIITGIEISTRGGTDAWRTSTTLRNRKGFLLGDLKPREAP